MKLPPQNIEAEESLLCSCLLRDSSELMDILVPEDFYKPAHQKIFQAVSRLNKTQQPIDLTSVFTELKVMGCLEECGGATYISRLLDIPQASNMLSYAKMVKSASVGRQIISKANDISNSIYDTTITSGNIVDLLDKAQADMLNIKFELGAENLISFPDLCLARVGQYEELCKGNFVKLKTGFHSIDYLTGGFWGSKLIIIAARPRVGKTALMLNMAKNMASTGHRVGIFSIEMDKESLFDRQVASLSGINSIRLATGKLGKDDWKKINEAAEKIYQYSIFIDDTGGLTIQEIKRRARKMVKHGVEIIFIDQLSKIRGGQGKSEYEQRSFIVNEFATLKKELRMPIVLLAQINRKADDSADKRPTLSALKSTGCIYPNSIVSGKQIKDIVENKISMKIKSYDINTKEIKNIQPSRYIHSGKKKCLKIKTKSGKEIVLSTGTKLFDGNVWRQSRTFIVGDKILVDFSIDSGYCSPKT